MEVIFLQPVYDPHSHDKYRQRVLAILNVDGLPFFFRQLAYKFLNADLSKADQLMRDRYGKCGPRPRKPSDMLRSMLLMIAMRVTSITKWAERLKTDPFVAILSGFQPGNVPGTGTFYDFMTKLWGLEASNFSPAERLPRKIPGKPKNKGEKAPSVEKNPVEAVIAFFENGDLTPEHAAALKLLFEIFRTIFLERSIAEGFINLSELHLAGDGTPIVTCAQQRSKRICNCRERGISDCTCARKYSQPDCDWGYDSHRKYYFCGYDLYLLTDSSSGHDLPIFGLLGPASRHDSHGLVHTWFTAEALIPDFHAARVFLDSAHDALAIYELFDREGTVPFIDLNTRNSSPLSEKDYTIGKDGVPVCSAGCTMKFMGFDKAQHRLKYRCPMMHMEKGCIVCKCENPCSEAKYGRQIHVYPSDNPRLFCTPPRGTDAWKDAYKKRTGAERTNKRIKNDYKMEDGNHRSTKAWYCRLFLIMMLMHLDAWSQKDSSSLMPAA